VPQYKSPEDRGFITYVCMVAVDASTTANGCPELGWECWQRKEGWLREIKMPDQCCATKEDAVTFQDMGPYEAIEMDRAESESPMLGTSLVVVVSRDSSCDAAQ